MGLKDFRNPIQLTNPENLGAYWAAVRAVIKTNDKHRSPSFLPPEVLEFSQRKGRFLNRSSALSKWTIEWEIY